MTINYDLIIQCFVKADYHKALNNHLEISGNDETVSPLRIK